MRLKYNGDILGILTSIIHCALLPLIMSSLPLLGIDIIGHSGFEWAMITVAFAVGSVALFHGYTQQHHSLIPVLIFAVGFVFLLLKQVFHEYESWLLGPAVLLILSAHFYNYRIAHRHDEKSTG